MLVTLYAAGLRRTEAANLTVADIDNKRMVTPALLPRLRGESIADKELSVLLARDQLVPIVHGTTYEALRDVSPMLASRTGLSTAENPMATVAAKLAELVALSPSSCT